MFIFFTAWDGEPHNGYGYETFEEAQKMLTLFQSNTYFPERCTYSRIFEVQVPANAFDPQTAPLALIPANGIGVPPDGRLGQFMGKPALTPAAPESNGEVCKHCGKPIKPDPISKGYWIHANREDWQNCTSYKGMTNTPNPQVTA